MAIPDPPNAKGDLLVADATPEWQLLPVGNAGEVLFADPDASLGVAWRVPDAFVGLLEPVSLLTITSSLVEVTDTLTVEVHTP